MDTDEDSPSMLGLPNQPAVLDQAKETLVSDISPRISAAESNKEIDPT